MIYIKRFDTCFLRIPKTGSQSLHLFLEKNVIDFSNDVIARPILQTFQDPYQDVKLKKESLNTLIEFETAHVTAQFVIDNGIATPTTRFVGVIRNPYERQISNYLYRIRRQQFDTPKNSEEFISNFRKVIKDGILSIALYPAPHQKKAKEIRHYHTMKQIDFFRYRGDLLDNINIWILDNLKLHLNEFCNYNNIEIIYELPHINKSPGNKRNLVDILYTTELKERVYEIYKEDFELYYKLKGTL
tara:strand:- start:211 stop:942 length:732 start_codon:yes stop_codon:yes gene_type:complete